MFPITSKHKLRNTIMVLLLVFILLAACSGGERSTEDQYPPPIEKVGPVDGNLNPDSVIIDGNQVIPFEEAPSGYGVRVMGTMPTPCHRILVDEAEPDEQDQIFIDLYAVSKPDEICIQVIEVFDITIPLEVFDPDLHTVWVNGEKAGQK